MRYNDLYEIPKMYNFMVSKCIRNELTQWQPTLSYNKHLDKPTTMYIIKCKLESLPIIHHLWLIYSNKFAFFTTHQSI
jgi:hypothetical protein